MEALDLKKSGEHWKAKSSITANVACMISWGLRSDSLSKYTDVSARQYAENSTATPINYTHC